MFIAGSLIIYFFAAVGVLTAVIKIVNFVKIRHKKTVEKDAGQTLSPRERKFMNDISSHILENISDPHLNVQFLTRKMGYSRTGLFTRLKQINGMGPNEFISETRLKMAAQMILQGEHSLQEISDETGFSSYSYFSKSFKKRFGVPPKEYRG